MGGVVGGPLVLHWQQAPGVSWDAERMTLMTGQMATETTRSRGQARWYPRWAPRLLAGVVALVALALVAVEVVWPLSAGLPIGWGQYQNSAYHLHIGTPALWNVTADANLNAGAANNCALTVTASPNSEAAPRSTLTAALLPRWMSVSVFAPCDANAGSDPHASLWQSTGRRVTIAGVSAPIESETVGAPQVSYRASVTLHGYIYVFTLRDSSDTQAQRDLPAFLTFMRSFQYVS